MRGSLGAALVGIAVATACTPTVSRPQTATMANTGKIAVTADVLRARVNDLVDRSAGRIELTADRIMAGSTDADVRRLALRLKVDAIPAVYTAGFRVDPFAAAIDVWGFAFQFNQYVSTGAGGSLFGPQQQLAVDCARDLLADADAVIKTIAIKPEHFDTARARVETWAKTNPVEHALSSRASAAVLVADFRSGDRDVFVAVGAVTDLIEDLSERLNIYAAQLPKQARWQAEILVSGMTGPRGLEGALGDLQHLGADLHDLGADHHEVSSNLRKTTNLLTDLPTTVLEAERNILASERKAVLADINAQREQTLQYLSAERVAIIAAVREERVVLLEAIRKERLESLVEMNAMETRGVDSAIAGFRDLIDYTLWRVAALTLGLMLAAGVFVVIGYRLTVGRRQHGSAP